MRLAQIIANLFFTFLACFFAFFLISPNWEFEWRIWAMIFVGIGIAVFYLSTKVGEPEEGQWANVESRDKLERKLREEIALNNGIDLTNAKISINYLRRGWVAVVSVFKPGTKKQWCVVNPVKDAKLVVLSQLFEYEELQRWLNAYGIPKAADKFIPIKKIEPEREEKEKIEESDEE